MSRLQAAWRSSTALLGGTSRELIFSLARVFFPTRFRKSQDWRNNDGLLSLFGCRLRRGGPEQFCGMLTFVAFAIAAVHWARSFIWVTAMSTDLASGERRNQRDDHPIGSEAASCLTKGAFLYPQERTCAVH